MLGSGGGGCRCIIITLPNCKLIRHYIASLYATGDDMGLIRKLEFMSNHSSRRHCFVPDCSENECSENENEYFSLGRCPGTFSILGVECATNTDCMVLY